MARFRTRANVGNHLRRERFRNDVFWFSMSGVGQNVPYTDSLLQQVAALKEQLTGANAVIMHQRVQLEGANAAMADLQSQFDGANAQVIQLRSELDSANARTVQLQSELDCTKVLMLDMSSELFHLRRHSQRLDRVVVKPGKRGSKTALHDTCRRKMSALQAEVTRLTQVVCDGKCPVVTKEHRPDVGGLQYTEGVLVTCMRLMFDANIAACHVSKVIRIVGENFFQKVMTGVDLPGRSFMGDLLTKAHVLTKIQLAEVLTQQGQNTVLYTDGTTKKFRSYAGFQVAVEDEKPLQLSLKRVPDCTSATLLDAFDTTIDDLLLWTIEALCCGQTDDRKRDLKAITMQGLVV